MRFRNGVQVEKESDSRARGSTFPVSLLLSQTAAPQSCFSITITTTTPASLRSEAQSG